MGKALSLFLLFFSVVSYANIEVIDGVGNKVRLKKYASRIVSLSPNLTEMLFDIGAGSQIIARDKNSDYPPLVKKIPVLADYYAINLERIFLLHPDLILIEQSSYLNKDMATIKQMGIPVYINHGSTLVSVAKTYLDLGELAGHKYFSTQRANSFLHKITAAKKKYASEKKVTVFYELWATPLLTVNNHTIISDIITACGGINIFGTLFSSSPHVSVESVLKRKPQVILSTVNHTKEKWCALLRITGEGSRSVYYIDPNQLERTGPRLLGGLEKVCLILDKVRHTEDRPKLIRDNKNQEIRLPIDAITVQ